ncbi:hypothetical protein QGP82_14605 [Leptothoe sp. LEGE 181152]|nr:hypothetical protein [Leptothoe sp. LEGE 181152]
MALGKLAAVCCSFLLLWPSAAKSQPTEGPCNALHQFSSMIERANAPGVDLSVEDTVLLSDNDADPLTEDWVMIDVTQATAGSYPYAVTLMIEWRHSSPEEARATYSDFVVKGIEQAHNAITTCANVVDTLPSSTRYRFYDNGEAYGVFLEPEEPADFSDSRNTLTVTIFRE